MALKRQKKAPEHASQAGTIEARVQSLEAQMAEVRGDVAMLNAELAALRGTFRQFEERQIRGERVLLELQGSMRKVVGTLDQMAKQIDALMPPKDPDASG